jgi:hypothetical protein
MLALAALDPDLAFVAALLSRSSIERAGEAPDWLQVAPWAARHRVVSLVHDALRQADPNVVPPRVLDGLRDEAQRLAAEALRQIVEAARLTELFAARGIRCLTLKGPALSVLAFGDPVLRNSRDIDLLVEAEAFAAANALLAERGWRRVKPVVDRPAYRRWVHEYVYRSANGLDGGMTVEIKDRLHPAPSLMPIDLGLALGKPYPVNVAGHLLPTLEPVDLFLYLCTHGSRHGWFRLKWIADIAALAGRLSDDQWLAAEQRAAGYGIARPIHEALLVSEAILGAPVPERFRRAVSADRAAADRAARVPARLATLGPGGNPLASAGFVRGLDWNELGLRPGWRYRSTVLQRLALQRVYAVLRSSA